MMTATMIELRENLKALNLSTMARDLEAKIRQAKESGPGYDEFLLELTTAELQVRAENRLNRRMREAKFPLLKTLEGFDFAAVPDLDIRLLRELAGCEYIKEHRNVMAPRHFVWI